MPTIPLLPRLRVSDVAVMVMASAKSSPGVSLAAYGLLHCWQRAIVGIELDESGGTWAYRHGLSCEPGLASLAATQQPLTLALAAAHGHRVSELKAMVCAPKEGTIVRAATGWLSERLLAWPEGDDLLIDLGRLRSGELDNVAALGRAEIVLLMTGTRPEELASTASIVVDLAAAIRPTAAIHLLFVASGPYSADEAADALNALVKRRIFRIAGSVPFDPKSARELSDGGRNAAKVASRWFAAIATELAAATAHRTPVPSLGAQLLANSLNGAH